MSKLEMKVPSPGESISEVIIATWLVKDGDYVEDGQTIAEIDSDKATLELPAEASGVITLAVQEGDTVAVGQVVCYIDTAAAKPAGAPTTKPVETKPEEKKAESKGKPTEAAKSSPPAAAPSKEKSYASGTPSVSAAKIMAEKNISSAQVSGTGPRGRITKGDVLNLISSGFDTTSIPQHPGGTREERREKMSNLRKKISERLVSVKNETAMLTTFNEVNMKPIMDMRKQYKDIFKEKHGVGLGFMSFFTKAVSESLFAFPAVNARIDGGDVVFHDYTDIGIAVSGPKGLMVPNLRNAEMMSLAEIESNIASLAKKVRDGKITVDDMQGGTFTITNGGVFGSMMSTPIINPPQSAILGMHNIIERPVVENGQIVVRPMMYLALSYDHRIIDGRESVSFLVNIKNMLENPERMLFGGKSAAEVLLGL